MRRDVRAARRARRPAVVLISSGAACLGTLLVCLRLATRCHRTSCAPQAPTGVEAPTRVEGHYDARKGAAGYSPVVAAFGSLAVPAVILLFTLKRPVGMAPEEWAKAVTLTAGLLVVGILGSVFSSLGLAGIAGEQYETDSIPPAVLWTGLSAAIAIVAIVSAFEILGAIYFTGLDTLFVLGVAATGAGSLSFVSLVLVDAPDVKHAGSRRRILNREQGVAWAYRASAIGLVPIGVALCLRLNNLMISLNTAVMDVLVISGLLVSFLSPLIGGWRSYSAKHTDPLAVQLYEAFLAAILIGIFAGTAIDLHPVG